MPTVAVELTQTEYDAVAARATRLGNAPADVLRDYARQVAVLQPNSGGNGRPHKLPALLPEDEDPLLLLAGSLKGGPGDLGERHDYYLTLEHSDSHDGEK